MVNIQQADVETPLSWSTFGKPMLNSTAQMIHPCGAAGSNLTACDLSRRYQAT